MQEQINQLQREIIELKAVIQSMRAEATIPYDIREALKASLGSSIVAQAASGTTYTHSVNEAGSATYSVANVMDGSIPIVLNGSIYNIPYYL